MTPPTTLERLRMLTAVANHGTIAGAARSLGYTASAVSQHLSTLEREANTSLVERSNRGVTLTSAGRLLAARAGDVLDLVRNAFDEVDVTTRHDEIELVVAAFPTAISGILLPIQPDLHPSIRLKIVDAESEPALRMLVAREVDAAITDGEAHLRHGPPDTDRTKLRSEPVRLVARTDRVEQSLAAYADTPWVLGGADSSIARVLRRLCHANGFVPNVIAETDDHHIAFDVIRASGAVTVLPELALSDLPSDLTIVTGIDVGFERDVEFVTRASLRTNPAIVEFRRRLQRT